MEEIKQPWNLKQLETEEISKKQIIEFLQKYSSNEFLKKYKLNGKILNISKSLTKTQLIKAYHDLFESKSFKNEEEEKEKLNEKIEIEEKKKDENIKEEKEEKKEKKEEINKEIPKFKKIILKKGDGKSFPKKGDIVLCRYKGTLEDGKVFDQNMEKVKKTLPPPLKFKVGTGKVIRGWDEGILTMSIGEKAKFIIEPEWAYGKKGLPDAGIPSNAILTFEIELENIE